MKGASLYYFSTSLGTWPLRSKPGVEPVPPALGEWSLSHQTIREAPKKELYFHQVGCSLLAGPVCALLPRMWLWVLPRRVLGDGVPTSLAPHSPSHGPSLARSHRL